MIDDGNLVEAALADEADRVAHEAVDGEVLGMLRHPLADRGVEGAVAAAHDHATEVAVGEDPGESAGLVDEHRRAGASDLAGGGDRLADGHGVGDDREIRADPEAHDLGDRLQSDPEHAAGVMAVEVVGGEVTAPGKRQGEGVARCEHRGRRGGRGEAQRTGLDDVPEIQVDIALPGEARVRLARKSDPPNAIGLQDRREGDDLLGLPGEAEQQGNILGADPPEVAMDGLGRMDEMRGLPEARERRRDLRPDEPRLAHAGDDDMAAAGLHEIDRLMPRVGIGALDAVGEPTDGVGLGGEGIAEEALLGLGIVRGARGDGSLVVRGTNGHNPGVYGRASLRFGSEIGGDLRYALRDMDHGPDTATLESPSHDGAAGPPASLASPSGSGSPAAGGSDDYQVRLTSFQGPMDLLLYLIRRAEVDIHDIPIHEITAQYFTFLKQLKYIDIDAAGEFLVTAATLIEIKSRTLAPRPEGSDDGDGASLADDPTDPRAELVQQLLAYQRFRNAAEQLDRLRAEYANRWAARIRVGEVEAPDDEAELDLELEDAHILDLFQTYERIISAIDVSRLGEHKVAYDDTPITLHQTDLIDRLKRTPLRRFTLRSVFEGRSRGEMIGLFLATLELARQRQILIRQDELTLEIELELNPEDDGVMHFETAQPA